MLLIGECSSQLMLYPDFACMVVCLVVYFIFIFNLVYLCVYLFVCLFLGRGLPANAALTKKSPRQYRYF